ncbi:SMP-30/gluconolactonase/LRE family protein [Bradyrhizobium sp. WYCCWR 13023]|uniref:SMP-30/gluconolactonase/LRE family protein n=1 Tax=Bradyrhizobium zhengyangense TaxID=2911009 RepID=A0A9X1RJG9_9BRAD|nr:SMP-30/gluconolactonase/LRE family protein [Bradyrhizobium zhengyangense]MCG2631794.1 SMP-30/gluconolactonase/LRE family protein [Bradyrhizobium zhengyangense]
MAFLTLFLEALIGAVFLICALGVGLQWPTAALLLRPIPESRFWRIVVAMLTALPGVGMIVAATTPFIAFFASMLSVIATALLGTASKFGGGRPAVTVSAALMLASVAVAVLQPLGLKVLSLPKADALPFEPVPARVIKTYAEGVGFESVRSSSDGTLYLTANIGLDFSSDAYFRHAYGEIIARRLDGHERLLFTTPVGSTAGVIAVAPDGTIYMTSNGWQPCIWRVTQSGQATKIATLPGGSWPNGLDFGPDGMLYTPDSSLAQIWRIEPETGKTEVVLRDKRLAARPFIALAPGANGLHFAGRDMIVTVSDSTEVLKYRLDDDGHFGAPTLVARGIPGDDFAVGRDGSLFVTTHPYNTLVRIAPDGRRSTIADARKQIVGATDASFGRGPDDRDTLYIATDGGAFTAGPKARGQLIALEPYR